MSTSSGCLPLGRCANPTVLFSSIGAIVSPYIDETYDYVHPFRVEHMHYALNILLPHIARVRSLAILTDRWAPMQVALECLSFENPLFVSCPSPLPRSLPMLESLVLMRCNEFVSYDPHFSPRERRDSSRLPFRGLLFAPKHAPTQSSLLPRLRVLSLSGVHLDWSSLPSLLPSSTSPGEPGLRHLELSYHSADVRPSEKEFRDIIGVCQSLKSLTICVSGPRSPASAPSRGPESRVQPVALPYLTKLELGYDDIQDATVLLGVIDATGATHVTFEDASSPERDETLDAGTLLMACTKAVAAGSPNYGQPLFPRAQSVTLRRVEASAEAFQAFYGALPEVRELTVAHMFLLGAEALTFRNVDLTFIPPELPRSVRALGALSTEHELLKVKPALSEAASCGTFTHAVAASTGLRGSERGGAMLW